MFLLQPGIMPLRYGMSLKVALPQGGIVLSDPASQELQAPFLCENDNDVEPFFVATYNVTPSDQMSMFS